MPAAPARLVVLVSGAGTNLQALLDAAADPAYGAAVVAVGADRDGIEGLARAERAGIPTFVHRVKDFTRPRDDWDAALTATVAGVRARPGRLAGFMKLVGADVPAPRSAAGSSTPTPRSRRRSPACTARATRWRTASRSPAARCSSSTTGVDTGPIVAQGAVPVADDDTVESLHERIKVAERAHARRHGRPDGPRGLHHHRQEGPDRP